MYKTRDDIMDALGTSTWTQVEDEFSGMSESDIYYEISRMFINDKAYDNQKLAEAIYEALK